MAEGEETGLECQVSQGESDDDSSFEVIEDPKNPRVSTGWSTNGPVKVNQKLPFFWPRFENLGVQASI